MKVYPLPPPLHDSTIFLMVRVMKEGYRRANELFKDEKLRLMHFAATAYIATYDDISQKILSELLFMDPSDMGVIVQDLEEAGFIIRRPNDRDRRRLNLTITSAGEEWLQKRSQDAHFFEEKFLTPLSEEERATYRRLLTKLSNRT